MLVASPLEETRDGIVYKNIESDAEMVAVTNLFFEDFVKGEPMNKSISGQFDGKVKTPVWEKEVTDYIKKGYSIIAVEKETNSVVGFNICSVIDLQNATEDSSHQTALDEKQLDVYEIINSVCLEMIDVHDLLREKLPSVQKITYCYALCVSEKFRGRSIGFNLMELSLKISRNVGCQFSILFPSNIFTVKIVSKLGFQKIKTRLWNSFEIDGKKIFEGKDLGAESGSSYYLDLTSNQ